MVLSLSMPFSTFRIHLDIASNSYANEEIIGETVNKSSQTDKTIIDPVNSKNEVDSNKDLSIILVYLYFAGLLIFGLRLLIHLFRIIYLFITSEHIKKDKATVLINEKIRNPLSFFNWIFIPKNSSDAINEDILKHERIHALQYHSIDMIMIELLSAVMWFNPLVWMMKNSVQLVHEFLADEGVLSTGTDKLGYQALLINQIAEEKLICLSSGFNHSLIKKRMIMMTKSKFNQGSKLKILTLIPLATVLFFAVACINGQDAKNVVAAIAPVKMNVLYLGVDNPLRIAVSGYDAADLTVTVDNGQISGKDGDYIIQPGKKGVAMVTVSVNGKEIQKTEFRVKIIPDPVARLAGKKGGVISKSDLLEQEGIDVIMENFDFDLNFEIVEFSMSSAIDGYTYEQKSSSDKFTDKQKELISMIKPGNQFYIQDIKCKGPDGILRPLATLNFKVED